MQTTSAAFPCTARREPPAAPPRAPAGHRGASPRSTLAGRAALRAAAALAPALTARALARRFLTPHRVRLDPRERAVLASSVRLDFPLGTCRGPLARPLRVAAYVWAGAGPTVLLVHGWSSAAGQLAAFVETLRLRGCRVVAFDAPAHGASGGTRTSAVELAEVVLAAGRLLGPLEAVIGHSAGATAAARAVSRGLAAGRLALVSPWARPQAWVERFAAMRGLSPASTARLVRAVEAEAGERLRALELSALVPVVAVPTLIVHDRDDPLVDVADVRAAAAALSAGTLVETGGLGHSRILQARAVVDRVVEFVAG